jgi:hypothetical protein
MRRLSGGQMRINLPALIPAGLFILAVLLSLAFLDPTGYSINTLAAESATPCVRMEAMAVSPDHKQGSVELRNTCRTPSPESLVYVGVLNEAGTRVAVEAFFLMDLLPKEGALRRFDLPADGSARKLRVIKILPHGK